MGKYICTLQISFIVNERGRADEMQKSIPKMREVANRFIKNNLSCFSPGELLGEVYGVGVARVSIAHLNDPELI